MPSTAETAKYRAHASVVIHVKEDPQLAIGVDLLIRLQAQNMSSAALTWKARHVGIPGMHVRCSCRSAASASKSVADADVSAMFERIRIVNGYSCMN